MRSGDGRESRRCSCACRKIARAAEGARKRKRTCSGVRGEELHPGSSSSTSSPFSLDRSVHILLWEKDNCAWTRRRPCQRQSSEKAVLLLAIYQVEIAKAAGRLIADLKMLENACFLRTEQFVFWIQVVNILREVPTKGSPTSRLWTALCDWLKDFCRSWRRASEVCTCDCSIDT